MNSEVRIPQKLREHFLEVRILKRLVNGWRLPLSSGCEGGRAELRGDRKNSLSPESMGDSTHQG